HLRQPQERGGADLQALGKEVGGSRLFLILELPLLRRGSNGDERRAEPRHPVPGAETAHAVVIGRNETVELSVLLRKARPGGADRDLAERQLVGAAAEVHLPPL